MIIFYTLWLTAVLFMDLLGSAMVFLPGNFTGEKDMTRGKGIILWGLATMMLIGLAVAKHIQ